MLSLGQIKYAIDHNTGDLSEGQGSGVLELRGDRIAFEIVQFQDGILRFITISETAVKEEFHIERGSKGFYNISHKIYGGFYNIGHKIYGPQKVDIRARCKDLRQVQYEKRVDSTRSVDRNETSATGELKYVHYNTIIKGTGGNTGALTELLGALKTYYRNKDKGVLRENREERQEQNAKARSYQGDRRDAIRNVRTAVSGARAVVGLPPHSEELVISVQSVVDYTVTGLIEAARKASCVKGATIALKEYSFLDHREKPLYTYKSGVDAAKAAVGVAGKVQYLLESLEVRKAPNTAPAKMKELIEAWGIEAKKYGEEPYNGSEPLAHYFDGVANNIIDKASYEGRVPASVERTIERIQRGVSDLEDLSVEAQKRSKKVYTYGSSLLSAIRTGVKQR